MGEALPGYEMSVWYGAFGPVGLPRDLANRLNAEINKAMALPDIKARMDGMGVEVVRSTPQEFAGVLQCDADRYGKIIRDLGIKNE